jgi:regulatory protein
MTGEARERPAAKLLQRAVAALARREHSRAELARKLARWLEEDQGAADIEAVLDELQRRKLLSEERYAASVVRARAMRYGDARVAQDLRSRGVPPDVAKAALAGLRGSEYARARAQWARRFKSLPATLEERARQVRFLQARGFSSAVIRRVLQGDPNTDTDTAD